MRLQFSCNWLLAVVVMFAGLLISAPDSRAGKIHIINQIDDFSATTPEGFYRFEPNYLRIQPGDTLRFLNSVGNHTVKTIPDIWPAGVAKIDLAHQPQYDIVLTKPGVYGLKCKVHNRHGMFALVVVGDVKPDLDLWKKARLNAVGKRVFEKLYKRLADDLKKAR